MARGADGGDDPPDNRYNSMVGGPVTGSGFGGGRGGGGGAAAGSGFDDGGEYTPGFMEDEGASDLAELEQRLDMEVDKDFFVEPKRFHTLQRVIDVLGHQINDPENSALVNPENVNAMLENNPAYQDLKNQQEVVEDAIEHMAVIYCADLNGSVIQVGRIARQFNEAVGMVRALRRQVRDIQETIGASSRLDVSVGDEEKVHLDPQENTVAVSADGENNAATAMSLRELWLKKLECEAVLSLLDKLDIIRAAPGRFDYLVQPPNCRIGAAVLCLSQALSTMFSDDVAQVQALNKILEQLMLRKQKAEELIWDILHEVIYLRTANGVTTPNAIANGGKSQQDEKLQKNTKQLSRASSAGTTAFRASNVVSHTPLPMHGIRNPFYGRHTNFTFGEEFDDSSVNSNDSGASLFSIEEDDEIGNTDDSSPHPGGKSGSVTISTSVTVANNSGSNTNKNVSSMMIPVAMVEAELDLEADERRCLEEITLNAAVTSLKSQSIFLARRRLPRYADPVLALRILVESLAQLQRLDDVERVLSDGVEHEIRTIIQREQLRTFIHLEHSRATFTSRAASSGSTNNQTYSKQDMKHFRRHLTNILSAFGCILLRLSHLAQILRYRIGTEKPLMSRMHRGKSGGLHFSSSTLDKVLLNAENMMQREIKEFLTSCLQEVNNNQNDTVDNSVNKGLAQHESGLFSLGILEEGLDDESQQQNDSSGAAAGSGNTYSSSIATRSNVMELPTSKFVSTILFPKTKSTPQYRHALYFRRILAKWTQENETRKKQLAKISGGDTSRATHKTDPSIEEPAIEYLDNIIQKNLLPVMQEDAVNGTVMMLERSDAFDPVLDRNVYGRPTSNGPLDVDMCKACQALNTRTEPLFAALHRLPRGGEMYLPVVAVLEHVILTFISRVKQQVSKICNQKTALRLLLDSGKKIAPIKAAGKKGKNAAPAVEISFAQILESRWAYAQLLRAYADGDMLEASNTVGAVVDPTDPSYKGPASREAGNGISPLSPSSNDTDIRRGEADVTVGTLGLGGSLAVAGSVESEEIILHHELVYLKPFLDFVMDSQRAGIVVCSDEELMKASCLAHSLLKLSSQLESRLRIRGSYSRTLTSTRALREAIKTIKMNGIKMAKFCRIDMLMQTITRLSKICKSSTLVARDAVRIPSSVNDLGEYLTGASDNLREASGNAVTAYTFSSLEQYIPICIMETVRVIARGEGIITKSPLTMNGIEALDRSGSVLYRDLKGATSFDDSFWDVELAAVSFERSASYIAMMELQMDELVAYYTANSEDFTEDDFELMFTMDGPRRHGDLERWQLLQKHIAGNK